VYGSLDNTFRLANVFGAHKRLLCRSYRATGILSTKIFILNFNKDQ
jgi:hypothetical protein